ncbi:MAG: FGGY family carbohydrate kinase, partial [Acidobacteriota bacterium]
MSQLFVGFDCSTQGVTAVVVECGDTPARVVFETVINYDRDLSQYGTRHGVLPSDDPRVAVAPPQMWADALEMAMARIASSGLDLSRIRAISGCAQQHGTVYLDEAGGFSRTVSPIWQDASTTAECDEITRALGGDEAIARLTGSRAFERFAGPQIRRFWKQDPAAYARTARIHLISSFMASLLISDAAGPEGPALHGTSGAPDLQVRGDAPIDPGDGSGMSLMNLVTHDWDAAALDATAPDLRAKLPA